MLVSKSYPKRLELSQMIEIAEFFRVSVQLTGQYYDLLSSRPLTGVLHYTIVDTFGPSPGQ